MLTEFHPIVGVGRRAGAMPSRSAATDRRPQQYAQSRNPFLPSGFGPLGSEKDSADFKQTRVVLIAAARSLRRSVRGEAAPRG